MMKSVKILYFALWFNEMGGRKMKKLAFVVFALLLFFPGSLFAKSSKLWSVELEKSWSEAQLYKDGWQYTWRIHRQIVQSRNSRFSFRIGLMLVP